MFNLFINIATLHKTLKIGKYNLIVSIIQSHDIYIMCINTDYKYQKGCISPVLVYNLKFEYTNKNLIYFITMF